MTLSALVALALVAATASPPPEELAPTPAGERWRWNARERTATGIEQLADGATPEATAALDSALRLAPTHPTARYNAGSAHLAAGALDAEALLAAAAESATGEVARDAYFNLGNARLGQGKLQPAISAYEEALRRAPGFPPAQRNLEIALQRLEEQLKQQEQQPQQRSQDDQDETQDQEQQSSQSGDREQGESAEPQPPGEQPGAPSEPSSDPNDPNRKPREGGGNGQPGEQPPAESPQAQQGQPGSKPDRLEQFAEQPDMSRDQAKAILQAVEKLERDARRKQAAVRAKSKSTVEKDW